METFNIWYNSSVYTCFSRNEKFESYEEAVRIVIDENKYGVLYPQIIVITRV